MQKFNLAKDIPGPILVIGASGFVGANVLRALLSVRSDVVGTTFSGSAWRLTDVSKANIAYLNLNDATSIRSVIKKFSPKTIFYCAAFGGYSFEKDFEKIHQVNYLNLVKLFEILREETSFAAYVHAGSSSEYGLNASAPVESAECIPNSHYAVSKAAASSAIAYYGKVLQFPVVNLRLYSVYGPYEDSSRLIPVLCEKIQKRELPTLASPEVSRDFVHVDDVSLAFFKAALAMRPEIYGESFNIGTGIKTTMQDVATLAKEKFSIEDEPVFTTSANRAWDVSSWYCDPSKARKQLSWDAKISFSDGLAQTYDWWSTFLEQAEFALLTKKQLPEQAKISISAVVACYKDEQAIPIMHQRLSQVFNKLNLDYEIIFVNDCSPDNSAEVIREISANDPHVIGITHSRNFGSQAAFRSGMELSSKEACVLLDGDLQDPPELIEQFVEKWRNGADVVYGRRVKRDMPKWLEACYKAFYRLFALLSEIPIAKDAGDFSLIDHSVVYWILQCKERDSFLRGLRAYVGFKQEGVDYVRPERMFGKSTNNWTKNIGWAKKAIFSFSRTPLHILTAVGGVATLASLILLVTTFGMKFFAPESAPKGFAMLAMLVSAFGSATLLGLGLLGEYIGKIMEETKQRPSFIRKELIVHGEIKSSSTTREQYAKN